MNRKIAALFSTAMVLMVVAISCDNCFFVAKGKVEGGHVKATLPEKESLIGEWTSDVRETQLGLATFVMCLSQDGKFRASGHTQAVPFANSGTYRVAGNAITFTSAEGMVSVDTFRLQGDNLELTEQGQKPLAFHRSSGHCGAAQS